MYYTYAYLREDRTPYYIGKGSGRRMFSSYDRTVHPPKDRKRIILLKQNLTEEEAFKHEVYMIDVFGRIDLGTGILRNMTNGGDGIPGYRHTDQFKRFNSLLHKGKTISESQKQAVSKAHKGKARTEEVKAKISNSKMGIPRSKDVIEKYRMNNPHRKRIALYDVELNLIKEFDSMGDAARFLNVNVGKVSDYFKGKRRLKKQLYNNTMSIVL